MASRSRSLSLTGTEPGDVFEPTEAADGLVLGSYGWTGEAVGMIEDRMKSLKLKVPRAGLKVVPVPTSSELDNCRQFGRQITESL